MFGFKAHFEGPVNDAVELFFFRGCYVGVSAIENGITNICGIAPEETLRACEFHMDDFLASWPPLANRRASALSEVPLADCGAIGAWQPVAALNWTGHLSCGRRAGFHRSIHWAGLSDRSWHRPAGWISCVQAELGRATFVQVPSCSARAVLSGGGFPGNPCSGTGGEPRSPNSSELAVSDNPAQCSCLLKTTFFEESGE